jgi:predicted NBD/HSP70 family sugar kinase
MQLTLFELLNARAQAVAGMTTWIGIDIGGQSVKAAGIQGDAHAWTGQSQPYVQPGSEQLVNAIKQAVSARACNSSFPVGLCVPGLLDETGRIVKRAVNVPGLNGLPLDRLIGDALGCVPRRLSIHNDAVAAATDLVHVRGLAGRVICVALGTGVGMGILDDGVPLHVEGASPGHIGQIDVSLDEDPPMGPDGGAGSLEAYIGAAALSKNDGSPRDFIATATIDAAPLRALARAIRICHAIYRPHHIILAGGIGIALKPLIPLLKTKIDTHLTNIARGDWTLTAADHNFHAALGAARLAGAAR